jgi:hypothetical protein
MTLSLCLASLGYNLKCFIIVIQDSGRLAEAKMLGAMDLL